MVTSQQVSSAGPISFNSDKGQTVDSVDGRKIVAGSGAKGASTMVARSGPCTDHCECATLGLTRKDIEVVMLPSGHFRRVVKEPMMSCQDDMCGASCEGHGDESIFENCTLPCTSYDAFKDLSCKFTSGSSPCVKPEVIEVERPKVIVSETPSEVSTTPSTISTMDQPVKPVVKQIEVAVQEPKINFESDRLTIEQLKGQKPTKMLIQIGECQNVPIKDASRVMFCVAGSGSKQFESMVSDPRHRTHLERPQLMTEKHGSTPPLYRLSVNKQLVIPILPPKEKLYVYLAQSLDNCENDDAGNSYFLCNYENGYTKLDLPQDIVDPTILEWKPYPLHDDLSKESRGCVWLRIVYLPDGIGPALPESSEPFTETVEFEGKTRRRSSLLPLKAYLDSKPESKAEAGKTQGVPEATPSAIKLKVTTTHKPVSKKSVSSSSGAPQTSKKSGSQAYQNETGNLVIRADVTPSKAQ